MYSTGKEKVKELIKNSTNAQDDIRETCEDAKTASKMAEKSLEEHNETLKDYIKNTISEGLSAAKEELHIPKPISTRIKEGYVGISHGVKETLVDPVKDIYRAHDPLETAINGIHGAPFVIEKASMNLKQHAKEIVQSAEESIQTKIEGLKDDAKSAREAAHIAHITFIDPLKASILKAEESASSLKQSVKQK
ncbi:hypothetical protein ROZALSC1DRAFT_22023, partial [Rozella allomycis CSF55]